MILGAIAFVVLWIHGDLVSTPTWLKILVPLFLSQVGSYAEVAGFNTIRGLRVGRRTLEYLGYLVPVSLLGINLIAVTRIPVLSPPLMIALFAPDVVIGGLFVAMSLYLRRSSLRDVKC
jgi:hypothetical protein